MLKVWSFPSKSVLDLSRNSKQMWSSLHWWPQILDCSILFNVCYSQYQIPPPATIFSLKYSPISHLLYYIIIPRHSDLIVSTVNIPAPQPIISGIVMAWPATHFLPIHILTLSIISHSTVSHNRYHTGIIKYSLIKLINTVLHETHWLHGTTPDHCTAGHFPLNWHIQMLLSGTPLDHIIAVVWSTIQTQICHLPAPTGWFTILCHSITTFSGHQWLHIALTLCSIFPC